MKARSYTRIIAIAAALIIFAMALAACDSSKTALTNEEFASKATALGLTVQDNTAQYTDYGYVNSASTAFADDGTSVLWSVDFLVASSADMAAGMYETNKATFETYSGSMSTVSVGNYNTYERNSDGKYMYLGRVENTLLYVSVDAQYKDDVKKLIDSMGY